MAVVSTYEVQPGDTLADIASRYELPLERLLAVNRQIENPNQIIVGQVIIIPTSTPTIPDPAAEYDGITPAPGTTEIDAERLVYPPLTNGQDSRSAGVYAQVIDQFAVQNNPRYQPRGGETFCNFFLWDVTRAMGCEIPHWVDSDGAPALPFQDEANEMNVNGTVSWLKNYGIPTYGWKLLDEQTAQSSANNGLPAVAILRNPTGEHGHTAVIRPGQISPSRGATTAQAGSHCFNLGHLADGFGDAEPKFYVHA